MNKFILALILALVATPGFAQTKIDPKQIYDGGTSNTTDYLRRDGTWATPAGGGLSDGDKGDITVGSSGTTLTIDAGAVSYSKMQDVSAASKLLGRGSAGGSGDAEEITVGSGLTMTGTTLSASGGGSSAWTQIGSTLTPGAINSVEFNDIPNTYSDLLVVYEGTSHSAGTNQQLQMQLSGDGVTFTTAHNIQASTASSSAAQYGSSHFTFYLNNAGHYSQGLNNLADNATSVSTAVQTGAWRITGGIEDIRILWSGSATFDAGTIKLYGR